uniref:Uncharacterized protein n=1 Tax=Pipistrellus kuhlii TaxID=59472 RepID=A0A7J7Y8Z4_PIPKU|nr:hypothetical protein mPipKuh1_010251 [Pipistrellus kuhlii]
MGWRGAVCREGSFPHAGPSASVAFAQPLSVRPSPAPTRLSLPGSVLEKSFQRRECKAGPSGEMCVLPGAGNHPSNCEKPQGSATQNPSAVRAVLLQRRGVCVCVCVCVCVTTASQTLIKKSHPRFQVGLGKPRVLK